MKTTKVNLALGVAGAALAIGQAYPAMAACSTSSSTVTCTADDSAANVQAAINAVAGGGVTLGINSGVNITGGPANITPSQLGAVTISNAGSLGIVAARVGVDYTGDPTSTVNTFSLTNSGVITGDVSVSGVGGTAVVNSTGSIGGFVDVNSAGNATVTVGGIVGTASALNDVTVDTQTTTLNTDVQTVGAVTTTTNTQTRPGSDAAATILAGGSAGNVSVSGGNSATVSVAGAVGSSTQVASVSADAGAGTIVQTSVSDTTPGATSSTSSYVITPTGGDATVAIASTGSVSGDASADGLTSATVTNAGTVGGDVSARSLNDFGSSFASTSTSHVVSGTAPNDIVTDTVNFTNIDPVLGGAASVQNAAGAKIGGSVSSVGLTSAGVDNAGTIAGDVNVSAATNQHGVLYASVDTAQASGLLLPLTSETTLHITDTTVGGDASLTNAAGGKIGTGSGSYVNVGGLTSATLTNAGKIDANVAVSAEGSATDSQPNFPGFNQATTNTWSPTGALLATQTIYTDTYSSTSTGGDASLTNAAGGLIGASQNDPVAVSVSGNGDATFANSGRVNGHVSVGAHGTTYSTSDITTVGSTNDPTTGNTSSSYDSESTGSSTPTGGTASFANNAGGLIVGSVNVSGDAAASVVNAGVVTGTTQASSSTGFFDNSHDYLSTSVFTAGATGGTVNDTADHYTSTSGTTGGDVTGTYAGTNGSVQFVPPYGYGTDGTVTQTAAGNSAATVSGTIYGNFNGSASSETVTSESLSTTHRALNASAVTTAGTDAYTSSSTSARTGGDSSLAMSGGKIAGSVDLFADRNASAQLGNGALIEGDLNVTSDTSGYGSGRDYTTQHSDTTVYAYNASGTQTGYVETIDDSASYANGAGKASATLGQATINGDVSLTGAKGGAQFDLAAKGVVGGSVGVSAYGNDYATTNHEGTTVAGATSVYDRTQTYAQTDNGGNVSGTVAGTINGGLDLYTNAGSASLALSGQVQGSIAVQADGSQGQQSYTQHADANGTVYTSQSSGSDIGGTATLTVTAPSLAKPASMGDIYVAGVGGSTVTIGANSQVLGDSYFWSGHSLQVGDSYSSGTYADTTSYPVTGLGSFHSTSTSTAIGGAALLTNAGVIGHDYGTSYFPGYADVLVTSIGGATATNSGRIFGDLSVVSLDTNYASTYDRVNIGDATEVDTGVTDYSAVGGAAAATNSGLVTGSVSLAGATGTLTNGGVIRGDVNLGRSVDNYVTTTIDTLTQLGTETVTTTKAPFAQTYTVNQNGLLGGTVNVDGVYGPLAAADGSPIQTSAVTATVNLNSGSVTTGGVAAQYDEVTGQRFTTTNVNLNGSGNLGLNEAGVTALGKAFAGVDPAVAASGDLGYFTGGARVTGVETMTKTGAGVFTIVGADYVPATPSAPVADYTLDLGQFAIQGGEVQLATADGGQFGIRGDLANSASLVLGTRVTLPGTLFASNLTSTGTQAIDGVKIYQNGNFVQTSTGSLTVGMMPSLVRAVDPSVNGAVSTEPLAVQSVLYGQGLFTTPAKAYGSAYAALSPSFVTVDGNLSLAGTVNVLTPRGGLFVNGQSMDLFSVSGTVTKSAKVQTGQANNFVSFDLVTRTAAGRQVVAVVANRVGYETAAKNANAAAAGAALSAALPGVVSALQADAAGTGPFASVNQLQLTQDLATVMAGLDTQLTAAQAAQALNELGGGSYYGSLMTVKTTAPFVDALSTRRLPEGARGFTIWLEPNGEFVRTNSSDASGAARLHADNYGVSGGLGMATGSGEFGLGFGYGRIQSHSGDSLAQAKANTYMVGLFGRQDFGPISVSADLVYGWSNWDASRSLPTLSRAATASFDSKELRGDLRAEYRLSLGSAWVAPYGQLELRHFKFDGFDEQGAGSVGLSVKEASHTIVTPTLGAKVGSSFETGMGHLRPEAAISYTFNVNQDAFRDVAFEGAPSQAFRLQGVDPKGFANFQLGLNADIGSRAGAFIRGNYATGGGYDNASIRAGIVIGF